LKNQLKICFDIDGVICNNTWGNYEAAKPNIKAINKINSLYYKGHYIILFTSRYMGYSNENPEKAYNIGFKFIKSQLIKWKIKYHKLIMGKPTYDIIIDDKSFDYSDGWIDRL
tara:strand:+ start:400 stop:738 length:339 start_codon:yes stop_codon:yes gene_type:complete